MMKTIPKFSSLEEEASFWETNDSTQYAYESEEIVDSLKKPITLRLNESYIDIAKKLAKKKGMGYQTLIRSWIAERCLSEVHLHHV